MASKIFPMTLDLSGSNIVPHIDIRRNDYDSNVFSVQVTQGGLPFDFTGMNPIFECLTPDGHYIRDDGSQYGTIHVVDATQGKLEYTLVNEVFAVLGQIDVAYFAFEQSNADLQNPTNRVSTGNFSMRIIADALTGTTAAQDYMSDVTTLIQQINQLKTDYQTLNPTNYVTQTQFGTQNDSVASQLADIATNVKNFGADPTGVNDSTTAIQNAINYVRSLGGGIVLFPLGVYKYSSLSIVKNQTDKDMNIMLLGTPGTILASDKTQTTAFTIKGYDGGSFDPNASIRRVFIENIQFRGDFLSGTSTVNGVGIELDICQKIKFTNVEIKGYSSGGLIMKQCWDSEFVGLEMYNCGRANSSSDYAYALKMTKYYDNTNANHFVNCHFEQCPLMIFADTDARQNYFTNCKIEHGSAVTNNSGQAIIAVADAISISFSDCILTKNTQTDEPFIAVNNAQSSYQTTNLIDKSIKFTGCHFEALAGIFVNWLTANFTEIENCTFNNTNGGSSLNYPFIFGTKVKLKGTNKIIIPTADTQTLNITGNYNQIEGFSVEYKGSNPTKGAFLKMSDGVTNNRIQDFEIIGTPYASYSIPFIFLDSNIIRRKAGYVNETGGSSISYGADVQQFTNASPMTVTSMGYGYNGQTVTVRAKTAQVTMQNNANIVNTSGADLVLAAGKLAKYTNIQGVWYQV